MNKEVDIKCPACGKIFQVTDETYKKNEDIVCPPCGKAFKPQGNEVSKKTKSK